MSSQLEDALRSTLSSAADGAPAGPPGLVQDVEARHRRRRRRGYAAVAGVAVLAIAGGAALAVGGLGAGSGASTAGVSAAEGGEQPPIAEVWPEAYDSLAAKLDDGRKYRPETMVNDHELLAITEASFENADELWLIDLDAKRARRVAHLPKPHENRETFASHFTVGSGHVVWLDTYAENGKPYTRIWKAPLSGGEPSLVSTVTGDYGSYGPGVGNRLAVADGMVYLSHAVLGGVRKMPLSGGEATAVPDTAGYHILQWPWIGTPAGWGAEGTGCTLGPDNEPQCTRPDAKDRECRIDEDEPPVCEGDDEPPARGRAVNPTDYNTFTTIRNVETDEVREAVVPDGVKGVACHVTYCVGVKDDPEAEGRLESFSFRRDGSEFKPLPGGLGMEAIPVWDRFLVLHSGKNFALYDLKTGESGGFGIEPDGDGGMMVPGSSAPDARLISWSIDGGKSYAIIDLAAIK